MRSRNHLWHDRHAHYITTDDLHHADSGCGLKVGASVRDKHAFIQVNTIGFADFKRFCA